jgi:hypothetical protein
MGDIISLAPAQTVLSRWGAIWWGNLNRLLVHAKESMLLLESVSSSSLSSHLFDQSGLYEEHPKISH